MAATQPAHLLRPFRNLCRRCRLRRPTQLLSSPAPFPQQQHLRPFSTTSIPCDELSDYAESSSTLQITAAPPINHTSSKIQPKQPARIIPASPSYFTSTPQFTDNILLLQSLLREYASLPTVPTSEAPPAFWLKHAAYRSQIGEPVSSSRYSKVLALLSRLNRIQPNLQTRKLHKVMSLFRRQGATAVKRPPPGTLDEEGRGTGIGRRKEAAARVWLVEGEGHVLVNGRSVVDVFPRLHDRESALWPLKVTGRLDKYNVFAVAHGGGVTGQAESITLACARALMVHEPALKPMLRKAGCVTSDARRVERKKAGRIKSRKSPTWVKR